MSIFEELRLRADTLNRETEALNQQLAGIELMLAEMQLGVEAAVQGDGFQLGYRHFKKWGLHIYRESDEQVWPIEHAPRALRIKAALLLPALLISLKSAAEDLSVKLGTGSSELQEALRVMREGE